ncbi:MAG: ribonuclease III [Bacillota bacterium]|nr:ribonuclease III [Bacillota bacterium]
MKKIKKCLIIPDMDCTPDNPCSGKVDRQCYANLETKLGYDFKNPSILRRAVTHSSFSSDENYQRLEFLGDSLLGFVVAEMLFNSDFHMNEGKMTKYRSQIVRESALSDLALEIGLDCAMIMGKGEIKSEGYLKPSILADVFEAVIAAIYLDGGMEPAKEFIYRFMKDQVETVINGNDSDYKTLFQEFIQKKPGRKIEYRLLESSGDPQSGMKFVSSVYVDGELLGTGTGSTKKDSEKEAARIAYHSLNQG